MHYYKVFGLEVASEVRIPQFVESKGQHPDVFIRFGEARNLVRPDAARERAVWLDENAFYFFWDPIGSFLVRNGNEILIDPLPDTDVDLICLPLIGILPAALLQQRGIFVLHGSAVSIHGCASVFVGWKGAGKSTTAAILYDHGHPLLSDDVVAIAISAGRRAAIIPGFPTFKLTPETAGRIFSDDPERLPRVYEGAGKRFRTSAVNFASDEIPLKAIYTLFDGSDISCTQMNLQESLSHLLANTYLARYGKELIRNKYVVENLRQCSHLVNSTPVYRLERPRDLDRREDLAKLIESNHPILS